MNQAYHTPAISLSILDNALLRYFLQTEDYAIETSNHPLPKTVAQLAEEETAQDLGWSFMIASNVLFGMAFLVGLSSLQNILCRLPDRVQVKPKKEFGPFLFLALSNVLHRALYTWTLMVGNSTEP